MHLLQQSLLIACLCKLLFQKNASPPASHHADIRMLLSQNLLQTFPVIPMSSGNNHKVGIGISGNFRKSMSKIITQHPVCPCPSGVICKEGPVLNHRNRKSQLPSQLNYRHGYMAAATNHKLLPAPDFLTEKPCVAEAKDSAFGNVPNVLLLLRRKRKRHVIPANNIIKPQSFLPNVFPLQNSSQHRPFRFVSICNGLVQIVRYAFYGISLMNHAPGQNHCKNPFSWHNAVTHSLVDFTMTVAFLSNLGHFQKDLTTAKPGSQRQLSKVEALHNQIFAKSAIGNICPPLPEFLNFLVGQQTDLPVPASSMGISGNAPLEQQLGLFHLFFRRPSFFTYADCLYNTHISLLFLSWICSL